MKSRERRGFWDWKNLQQASAAGLEQATEKGIQSKIRELGSGQITQNFVRLRDWTLLEVSWDAGGRFYFK